ncbi:MAG: SPOR domain-containing protein [Rhodobacteraceae bacterium]|nr:SPOR domain-containing protein [Paracoccaceae bacterium]
MSYYEEAPYSQGQAEPFVQPAPRRGSAIASYTGAALSLSLLIGTGVWGYGIIMRDVSGIPVVRAMEGPMRIAPENPGGTTADHLGLAVNAVPAEGAAAATPDQLILAPKPVELVEEDRPRSELDALRPRQRPQGLTTGISEPVAAAVGAALRIDADSLPIGTRLAQLGAFDSAATAEQEWQRLSKRFSEFMGGKAPVIQEAQSGGRTFWRLRAHGFADLSEARRFCAALVAERAECIPVVTR